MEATLQNIFKAGFEKYKTRHGMSMDQYRAAEAIMTCQSDALGHEEWACLEDGHSERQNHSCRHRSCPRCHSAQTQAWLERIEARLIPTDHFHVVFTLPHELNPVWQYNRRWCSDRLFKASSETLRQLLADERHLGAEVGMISALHTWGRTLSFHPHVHVLVSGGGLAGAGWRAARHDYLLPVAALKAKFRGKWLSWLNAAHAAGEIELPPDWTEKAWRKTLSRVAGKKWNVRIQEGYRQGRGVTEYFSRYLRGGPIKDYRILSADDETVTFHYRDHQDGVEKAMTLDLEHFMSRVLWHVPEKGQHHVRYYGFYTPGAGDKRERIREHLGIDAELAVQTPKCEPRPCPTFGRPMIHRSSARRKISLIRNRRAVPSSTHVQQGDQVDRASTKYPRHWCPDDATPYIFWP
jgi:hypothetical protein